MCIFREHAVPEIGSYWITVMKNLSNLELTETARTKQNYYS